jgi:hypothetical protein
MSRICLEEVALVEYGLKASFFRSQPWNFRRFRLTAANSRATRTASRCFAALKPTKCNSSVCFYFRFILALLLSSLRRLHAWTIRPWHTNWSVSHGIRFRMRRQDSSYGFTGSTTLLMQSHMASLAAYICVVTDYVLDLYRAS